VAVCFTLISWAWLFLEHILQGSVAPGEIFNNHFTADFLENLQVKELVKSLKIWRVSAMSLVSSFWDTVYNCNNIQAQSIFLQNINYNVYEAKYEIK